MKQRLHRRLMSAFVAVALVVSALFGVFAMGLHYTIEQHFFERMLSDEAQRQQQHFVRYSRYAPTQNPALAMYPDNSSLPADLARVLTLTPGQHEVAGEAGRFYKVLAINGDAAAPWLVADTSRFFVVRPMRTLLQGWMLAWLAVLVGLSLAVGWWLARYMSAPLALLASRVASATPETLQQPAQPLAQGLRDDEVGAVAQRFDELMARTRELIAREQAFTRDASHELRTPLTVLRMAIQRLQAEPTLQPALRQQLAPMLAATDWMTQTLETLLLLAREAPPPPPAPVALLPLAERWVVAHAAWLDQQPLTLALQLQRGDVLWLPAPVLQLVIASLLGNAFTHGQAGGTVCVDFKQQRLNVRNPSDALPNGAGDEFVKGQASTGLGLGLSIVRRLLQRHGGELHIRHEGGHTCISVSGGAAAVS
jgi:signal transduction histidine kinase